MAKGDWKSDYSVGVAVLIIGLYLSTWFSNDLVNWVHQLGSQ